MFPEAELLGVDIVIPDITYLKQNRDMVRAIVLTHGHEDHIGALPYILRDLNVPIYGTRFTLALVRKRLEEHGLLDKADLREVFAGRHVEDRAVRGGVHPRHAQHDRLRGAGHAHAGWAWSSTPATTRWTRRRSTASPSICTRSRATARKACWRSSATAPTSSGRATRRRNARFGTRIEELCRAAPRKVLVSCFASSIQRIQQVVDIAALVGRKIGFVGRSMVDNVEIAHTLGRLRIPDGMVIRPQDLKSFDPKKTVVLVSGSQAEPMSSLSRIAVDNHRLLSVDPDDTVILSARIIPGNEKAIFRMLDHMFRRRALVYYDNAGGTAARLRTRQPGRAEVDAEPGAAEAISFRCTANTGNCSATRRWRSRWASVSGEVLLLEDGHPIEFTEDGAYRREPVPAGRVCVDSGSLEEIEEVVIRDRKHLSEDGIVVPIIAIDKHTGRMESRPEMVTRGFMPSDDGAELLDGGARGDFAHHRAIQRRRRRPTGASSRKRSAWI